MSFSPDPERPGHSVYELGASAHRVSERGEGDMTEKRFPTARETAAAVRGALGESNIEAADRLITELFGRVIHSSGDMPVEVLEEPESTGDARYDTLLAVGLAYALAERGLSAPAWTTAVPALGKEWLWDGDTVASPEFRAYIRRHTPRVFLEKGLLLRDRDIRTV